MERFGPGRWFHSLGLNGSFVPRRGCCHKRIELGTLIRHAELGTPAAIGRLAVPVVQSPFGGLLMPAVSLAALLAACLLATARVAVALSAPAATANPENHAAVISVTELLMEVDLRLSRHASAKAGLDNRELL